MPDRFASVTRIGGPASAPAVDATGECIAAGTPAVDCTGLQELNRRIGDAESAADRDFFEALLCQQFVMMRPSGVLDDRTALIDGLATGATRLTREVEVVQLAGNRAVVSCLVTKWDGDGPQPADAPTFHNMRVFIRAAADQPWQLLAWLNEPLSAMPH